MAGKSGAAREEVMESKNRSAWKRMPTFPASNELQLMWPSQRLSFSECTRRLTTDLIRQLEDTGHGVSRLATAEARQMGAKQNDPLISEMTCTGR
ncbi:hypothetical protein WJX84_006865 [Apatococcus fuscideae]|uniref:Uncharacterized protein n=1 Tax=Apatococcus fuscideae TaxID=2026836 RepID=A0AAW1T6L3_9CHLO